MAFAELSTVRLRRLLIADDGRTLPRGAEGTVVHVWQDEDAQPAAFEIEVRLDDPATGRQTWHLATAQASDLELVAPPP